ncbi:MAG: hypothetical protein VYD19_03340 [Myxococcota bacterium]|nr:hypothetical protein [Myxococcota bacterium]
MEIIERLERAQEQTWWLPESTFIHEEEDCCFYDHGGHYNIVRFTPPESEIVSRLTVLREQIGSRHGYFTYFPHRHGEAVAAALRDAGFYPKERYEARAIHVERYTRSVPPEIEVLMVQRLEEMRRLYRLRDQVFGGSAPTPDENIRRFFRDASGPEARVRQFLALDQESGEAISQAGMSLFPELRFAFLFAGGTRVDARGRGAYTALVATRIAYARSVGIDYVGIFAREDSSAPIVTRQGFERYGVMQRWGLNGA